MMKDDDFKLLNGFTLGRTNERTDICDCRVTFATENLSSRICPKVDSDYPRSTCENVVYHFHGTMQTIITSSLRPAFR